MASGLARRTRNRGGWVASLTHARSASSAARPDATPDSDAAQTLRLVRSAEPTSMSLPGSLGREIEGPTDPRWVMAVRVAEQLEGTLLSPEQRQKLIRLGHTLGLTSFDANLIIAIVQDAAQRYDTHPVGDLIGERGYDWLREEREPAAV